MVVAVDSLRQLSQSGNLGETGGVVILGPPGVLNDGLALKFFSSTSLPYLLLHINP